MQGPAKDTPMNFYSTSTAPTNTNYQTAEQAAKAWTACLAEAKNNTDKYPRVPIENGPFATFEEMWTAKAAGDYDPSKPSNPPRPRPRPPFLLPFSSSSPHTITANFFINAKTQSTPPNTPKAPNQSTSNTSKASTTEE